MGVLVRCRHGTTWERVDEGRHPHTYELIEGSGCNCGPDEAEEVD